MTRETTPVTATKESTMDRVFLKAALLAACAMLPPASDARDLLDTLAAARAVDPDLLAASAALEAGEEKTAQGNALLLPQVQLSGSLVHVDESTETGLPSVFSDLIKPDSSGSVHEAELQLKQPLYDAEAFAQRRQLKQQTSLARISWRSAEQNLLQRVGETYLQVLLAQESLNVTQAEKAAVLQQRDRAQARFDVGRGKITDLQEAQARYDGVLAREESAKGTLAIRQAQYEELTGLPADGLADLRPGLAPQPPLPDDVGAWQARGLDHGTQVQSRQAQLAIATSEIDKYRLSARPTLDFVASYTRKGADGGLSPTVAPEDSRSTVFGVQLSVPLFAGGALVSRERESIAKQREAEQELRAAQRDTRLQVQDAFVSAKTGVARVGALEQSVRSAQTALEATVLGRDVGTRTELDVLDAQQRLYSAQLDFAEARHEYLMGRIRLASAAGELRQDDLAALNGWLVE